MARKKTTELDPIGLTEGSVAKKPRAKKAAAPKVAATPAVATPDDSQEAIQSSPNYSRIVKHLHKRTEMTPAESQSSAPTATAAIIVSTNAPQTAAAAWKPAHEDVAKLAYSYFVARGYAPGDTVADWLRAEQELVRRHNG